MPLCDAVRHVGDLGNIVADDNGLVNASFTDSVISLSGEHSIVGRGLVINYGADDLGLGDSVASKETGAAGGRIACGVIVPVYHAGTSSSAIGQWSWWTFVVVTVVKRIF